MVGDCMVEAYNELSGIISYLDAYDEETGEPGILFGDSNTRKLLPDLEDYFYAVFNPNNARVGSLDKDGKQQTWTWMDLGIAFDVNQTNQATGVTGSGWYSTMTLD